MKYISINKNKLKFCSNIQFVYMGRKLRGTMKRPMKITKKSLK